MSNSIAAVAEQRLRESPYPPLRKISCTDKGGVIVLRGCVQTYYYKQLAQATVAQIEGIKEIVNQIEVVSDD